MRYLIAIAIFLVAGVLGTTYLGFTMLQSGLEPVDAGQGQTVFFEVVPGSTTWDVAHQLDAQDLIKNPTLFIVLGRLLDLEGDLQAGWYQISSSASPLEIMRQLARGEMAHRTFTIPEGLTAVQTKERLVAAGLGDPTTFSELFEDPARVSDWLPADFESEKSPLEGYLHPDTYQVPMDADEATILDVMITNFADFWDPARLDRARKRGLTVHQAVTLASIVERETVRPNERPMVAGVFFNRLKAEMKLEACATVRFALAKPEGALTEVDLLVDDLYNTYRHPGLPPGPIASPGSASLEAVLHPASVPYYYFVARGDGSHAFAVTYQEHLANIAKYLE